MKIADVRLTGTLFVMTGALWASPSVGFVSQTFRSKVTDNVNANNQWNGPLFNLQIQSWTGEGWGFDIVQGTSTFAAATTSPSQSGWHDHPTALTIAQVVQGTVWVQESPNYGCLTPYPTGTIFFERAGTVHNVWNLDATTAAVTQVIHFVQRTESATRRDQPDPVSGSNAVAMMPPLCPPPTGAPAAAQLHAVGHSLSPRQPSPAEFKPLAVAPLFLKSSLYSLATLRRR